MPCLLFLAFFFALLFTNICSFRGAIPPSLHKYPAAQGPGVLLLIFIDRSYQYENHHHGHICMDTKIIITVIGTKKCYYAVETGRLTCKKGLAVVEHQPLILPWYVGISTLRVTRMLEIDGKYHQKSPNLVCTISWYTPFFGHPTDAMYGRIS